MNAILKRLQKLDHDELLALSEAIDTECERRMERADEMPESARRRAIARSQSYRHDTGAAAPPIRAVGLRSPQRAGAM